MYQLMRDNICGLYTTGCATVIGKQWVTNILTKTESAFDLEFVE